VARCPRQAAACPVGQQGRAAAATSAAAVAGAAAIAPSAAVYIQMGDKNLSDLSGKSVTVRLWRMLSRMCMQSLATIDYEMKKLSRSHI